MFEASSHRSDAGGSVLGKVVHGVNAGPLFRQCTRNLVHHDGSGETAAADEATLLAADSDIVSDDSQAERPFRVGDGLLLLGESEEQDVSSVAHDDGEGALVVRDLLDGFADLADIGRGKDVTADGRSQETVSDEACVCTWRRASVS